MTTSLALAAAHPRSLPAPVSSPPDARVVAAFESMSAAQVRYPAPRHLRHVMSRHIMFAVAGARCGAAAAAGSAARQEQRGAGPG
jgi:hypothetical protein